MKYKTTVSSLVLIFCVVAALPGCNSEQQVQVKTHIRNMACETLSNQSSQRVDRSLEIQAVGCRQGVDAVVTIALDLARRNQMITVDEISEAGFAWCADRFGRAQQLPTNNAPTELGQLQNQGFNPTMLLGCNLGISEGLTYSQRVTSIVAQRMSGPRNAPAGLPAPVMNCVTSGGSFQNIEACLGRAPISSEQLSDIMRGLLVNHNELVQQGGVAQAQAAQYDSQIVQLRNSIVMAHQRRDQATASVADLDHILEGIAQVNANSNNDRQVVANQLRREQDLPTLIQRARNQAAHLHSEANSLEQQAQSRHGDLTNLRLGLISAQLTQGQIRSQWSVARAEHDRADSELSYARNQLQARRDEIRRQREEREAQIRRQREDEENRLRQQRRQEQDRQEEESRRRNANTGSGSSPEGSGGSSRPSGSGSSWGSSGSSSAGSTWGRSSNSGSSGSGSGSSGSSWGTRSSSSSGSSGTSTPTSSGSSWGTRSSSSTGSSGSTWGTRR